MTQSKIFDSFLHNIMASDRTYLLLTDLTVYSV